MFWKPNCHCILMTARLTCFTILGLFKMPNLARPFVNVHYAISWSSLYWAQNRNCRETTNNEWPSKIAVGKSMMTNNNFCHKKCSKWIFLQYLFCKNLIQFFYLRFSDRKSSIFVVYRGKSKYQKIDQYNQV